MEGWWRILEISAGEDHGVFLLRGAWPQAIERLRRVVIYKDCSGGNKNNTLKKLSSSQETRQ